MARFNEILVGRYNRLIQKLLGMKGDASLFQFSTEMMAVLPMYSGAENRYLEQWDRFGMSQSPGAGGAGNRTGIRIRNPGSSNVIAVIEKLFVSGLVADNPVINVGPQPADFGTIAVNTSSRFDARGRQQPTLIVSNSGNVGATPAVNLAQVFFTASVQVELIFQENQELPILPGDALTIFATALNQGVSATFWWRERLLEESERA
jgi:hypothetical protein